MVRCRVVVLLLLALGLAGYGGWAADLSGEIGAEATFVPGFTTDLWVDLDWDLDGWSLGSLAEFTFFPGVDLSWTGTVGSSFGWIDVGAILSIDIVPFDFSGFDVYAAVDLFDVERDRFTASAATELTLEIYPPFGATLELDLDAAYGILSAWGGVDLDILAFGLTSWIGAQVRLLDLELENGSLTADLGGWMFLIPLDNARFWLDLALSLGAVTVSAETDFNVVPFGLAQQQIEVEIGMEQLSIYVWESLTGGGDLTVGIGTVYELP